jgi:apurinic endonuclease APN1
MYSSLLYIHQQTKDLNVKILLETSTGQGSEIGYKLEELTKIYRKLSKHKKSNVRNKFGICLDTCHVFSAGYNLSSKQAIEIFLNNFNEMIGIKEIKLIHLNDSKVPCGSNIDRHENFGNGYIGKDALKILGNAFIKKKIPIIIETSYPKIYDDLDFVLDSIIVQ